MMKMKKSKKQAIFIQTVIVAGLLVISLIYTLISGVYSLFSGCDLPYATFSLFVAVLLSVAQFIRIRSFDKKTLEDLNNF